MKYLASTVIALLFSGCITNHETTSKIVSGFVHGIDDESCQISPLYGSDKIDCRIKYSEDKKVFYVEMIVKGVFTRQQPVCVIDGAAQAIKDTNKWEKTRTRTTLISTSQIWVELPSYNKRPTGALFQFICSN